MDSDTTNNTPTCPSCGMTYTDHLGLNGTCAALRDVRIERDRLQRVLAVERGDESQAPEGWTLEHDYEDSRWTKGESYNFEDEPWAIVWPSLGGPVRWEAHTADYAQNAEGEASSALDALEAADAALEGFHGQ